MKNTTLAIILCFVMSAVSLWQGYSNRKLIVLQINMLDNMGQVFEDGMTGATDE